MKGQEEEGEEESEHENDKYQIFTDFRVCMCGYEDKESFQEAFDIMRSKAPFGTTTRIPPPRVAHLHGLLSWQAK